MRPSSRVCLSHSGKCRINSVLLPTIRSRLLDPDFNESSTSTPGSSNSSSSEVGRIQVDGWLKSIRGHKNVLFARVGDGSDSEGVQAVFKGKARVEGLDAGASVRLYGELVSSKGQGQAKELLVDTAEIIGPCDPESYPIQNKHLPEPVLRDIAHLRFRTTQTASIMRVRDGSMRDWHDWFEENEFIHIHTPLLTSSDCEGAGETFGIIAPGDPARRDPTSTLAASSSSSSAPSAAASSSSSSSVPSSASSLASVSESFFPSPVNLTVSSQLHLEAPTHSLSRTYTLSPSFRAEPSLTSRHLSEFYMLEGEVVCDSLDVLMDVVEDGIRSVLSRMLGGKGKRWEGMRKDLEGLRRLQAEKDPGQAQNSEGEGEGLEYLERTAKQPFHRITYSRAIEELSIRHKEVPFDNPPEWDKGLPSQQEKYLAGKYGPTFITHYPAHLKPFYMLPSPSPKGQGETVACFDLLFPGIGELAGGSMREHRLPQLEAAMERHGLDKEKYGWYLDLRRYGSAPHGGWGMGWDRWISWLTGVGNLRDVVAFPRWKGNCRY